MHSYGWHDGGEFPKMGAEGGRLSSIVRRKNSEELKKLPKNEQLRLKDKRREKRKERKEKEKEREAKKLIKLSKRRASQTWGVSVEISAEEYSSMLTALIDQGLLLF
jgi:hypothetical protein